jgi:hypothetical protein
VSGVALRAGLIASVLAASSVAYAQEEQPKLEKPLHTFADAPIVSIECGGGMMQPDLSNTTFSVLDTWNGQHTYYHSNGASLGLAKPLGFIFTTTMHVFPFAFRGIGFVGTFEIGGFTGNLTQGNSPFGFVDSTSNMFTSTLVGPEGQARIGSLIFRASALAGDRYITVGDYSTNEWRVTLRGQIDYLLSTAHHGDSGAATIGVFGAGDVLPAFGWTAGTHLSFAFM